MTLTPKPTNWDANQLDKLLINILDYRGKSVPKAVKGIPLITARNIRKGTLDFTIQEFVDADKIYQWMSRGIPQSEDILFTTEAPLGNVAYYPSEGFYAIGQRTILLRPDVNLIINEFLFYFILSDYGQRLIDDRSSGSTAKGIKSSELKKVKICYPKSITEQRLIAKMLGTWDKYLELLDEKITSKKAIRLAVMNKLFSLKVRVRGFSGKWTNVKLRDVASRTSEKNANGNLNILTISAQQGLISQSDFYNKRVAADNLKGYLVLNKGEFAYNKSYSNGYPLGAIKRLDKYDSGIVSSLYITFRNKNNIDPEFLNYYFDSGRFNTELRKVAHEGGRNHGLLNIKLDDFFDCDLNMPGSLQEQKYISNTLSALDKELQILGEVRDIVATQKKFLLNKLVTGEIRHPDFIDQPNS